MQGCRSIGIWCLCQHVFPPGALRCERESECELYDRQPVLRAPFLLLIVLTILHFVYSRNLLGCRNNGGY